MAEFNTDGYEVLDQLYPSDEPEKTVSKADLRDLLIIKAYEHPEKTQEEILEEFKPIVESNVDSREYLANEARFKTEDEAASILMENARVNPTGVSEYTQSYLELKKKLDVDLDPETHPHWKEIAILGRITDPFDQSDALRAYQEKVIHEALESQGTLETVWNYVGFLWPDMGWDASQITDDSYFDAADGLTKFINTYRLMSREEQALLWPAMVNIAVENFEGNTQKAVIGILDQLMNGETGYIDVNMTIDKIDAALTFGITKAISSFASGVRAGFRANSLKKSVKASQAKMRASVNADTSGKLGNELGIDPQNNAEAISPMNWADVDPGVPKNASGDIAEEIEHLKRELDPVRKELDNKLLHNDSDPIISRFLDETEMAEARERGLKSVTEYVHRQYEKNGWSVDEVKILEDQKTTSGFVVEAKMHSPGGVSTTMPIRVDYTLDDQTKLLNLEFNPLRTLISSPEAKFADVFNDIVGDASVLALQTDRIRGDLRNIYKNIWKGLNNKSKSKVAALLERGDEYNKGDGIVFTYSDLKYNGVSLKQVDKKTGQVTEIPNVRFTDAEIAAYFKNRDFYDAMHVVVEKNQHRKMVAQGWRETDLTETSAGKGGTVFQKKTVIAKTHNTFEDANKALNNFAETVFVPDMGRRGSVVPRKTLNFKKKYEEGYRLIELHDDSILKAGPKTNVSVKWALVKENTVRPLRSQGLLHKRQGYVPKINKNLNFFIVKTTNPLISGVKKERSDIYRAFETQKARDEYLENLRNRKGLSENDQTYQPRDKSNINSKDSGQLRAGLYEVSHGGLFVKDRSMRGVIMGETETAAQRASAHEAMQRAMDYIANEIPVNSFRMNLINRWTKTAKDLGHKGGFNDPLPADMNFKNARNLNDLRDWIRLQVRQKTTREQNYAKILNFLAEGTEKLPVVGIAGSKWIRNSEAVRLSDMFRTAAFHSYLGFLNPAQLYVQAQGAAIAFSLNPARAPKVVTEAGFLRATNFIDNTLGGDSQAMVKAIADKMGLDPDYALALKRDWDNSGFYQTVFSNADYDVALSGVDSGLGSVDGLRSLMEKGQIFYREGELVTRSYSFLFARDRLVRDGLISGKKTLGKDDLAQLMKAALRKQMNMTRANKAAWQNGLVGVPTQFFNYTAKMAEALLPVFAGGTKKFGTADKWKIMAGQAFLYGSPSLPFMGQWIRNEMSHLTHNPDGSFNEEAYSAVYNGFVGFLTHYATGELFDLGRRGAGLSLIEDQYKRLFVEDPKFVDTILGASYNVVVGAPKGLYSAMRALLPSPIDLDSSSLELALSEISQFTSTSRNFYTALLWESRGAMTNTKGVIIAPLSDTFESLPIFGEVSRTSIGKALGFTPSEVSESSEARLRNKLQSEAKQEASFITQKMYAKFLRDGILTDEEQATIDRVMAVHASLFNDAEMREIKSRAINNIMGDPLLYENYKKGLSRFFSNVIGEDGPDRPFWGSDINSTIFKDHQDD